MIGTDSMFFDKLLEGDSQVIEDGERLALHKKDGAYYHIIVCCDCALAHKIKIEDGTIQFWRVNGEEAKLLREMGIKAGAEFKYGIT